MEYPNLTEEGLLSFIGAEEIGAIVYRLAKEIRADYKTKNPILIGVLKGASLFLSDLVRALKMPLEMDFIQTSCYGKRDEPCSEVLILRDITSDIKERDIIIVEDIIDRGHTARALIKYLGKKGPSSIKVCSLLVRDGNPHDLDVDYMGKSIGPGFVVGYGMDYKENYRELPGLYLMGPK